MHLVVPSDGETAQDRATSELKPPIGTMERVLVTTCPLGTVRIPSAVRVKSGTVTVTGSRALCVKGEEVP